MAIIIRPLTPADASTCDAIILSLPDFFGHEGGRTDCANAVRSQAGWVAGEDGEVVGFATWEQRTSVAAEITWMAVRNDRRHAGAGTAIVERLVADLAERGMRLVLALTSAGQKQPHAGEDTYVPTRHFWANRGFLPLIELDIWDTDVALFQVRAIPAPQ